MAALRGYHQTRVSGSGDLAPVLGRVLLPVRSADGSPPRAASRGDGVFRVRLEESDDLEILSGPFGEAEFLDVAVPNDPEQR